MVYNLLDYYRFVKESGEIKSFYQEIDINLSTYYWPKQKSEDSFENPDHYTIFNYWVLDSIGRKNKILDIGNTKYGLMISSIYNYIDAIVLEKPFDGEISKVNYIQKDISDFVIESKYDIITSPSTLHLLGTGRYNSKINLNAIVATISKIKESLKSKGRLFVALPLGKDSYLHNYHFIFNFDTILKLFEGFNLADFFVDEYMSFNSNETHPPTKRFSKNTNVINFNRFQYKIIYLCFEKK